MKSNTSTTKKTSIGTLTALLFAGVLGMSDTGAFAQSNSGGFSGPGPALVTVQQAREMRDDSRVSLKGNIVKSLGDEAYTFKDATGTIEIEIDNDVWMGQTINPEDVVIISGEVDRDWNHSSIDVSSLMKQ